MEQTAAALSGVTAWNYVFAAYILALVILVAMVLFSWHKFRSARERLEHISPDDA